jgi:hypothetical protein
MESQITISHILMILAVLIAPLVAVQVQKYLERHQEKRERKLRIFKTLMATRGVPLSQDHVQALNMIDIEFYGEKYKKIITSWKDYLNHLEKITKDDEERFSLWNEEKADLLANLLLVMLKGCPKISLNSVKVMYIKQ